MSQVESTAIKVLGFTPENRPHSREPRERITSPCRNCGHDVIMEDGEAIHSPKLYTNTHKCWIVVKGMLGQKTFCGCEKAEWSK